MNKEFYYVYADEMNFSKFIYNVSDPEKIISKFFKRFDMDKFSHGSKIRIYKGKRYLFKRPILIYMIIGSDNYGSHNFYIKIYPKEATK